MLFGSGILELALGMILFYFLLSTLCSTLVELLSGLLSWRSQELIKGIQDVLDLPIASGDGDVSERPAGSAAAPAAATSPSSAATGATLRDHLGDRLLMHTMIAGMATKPGRFRRTFLRIRREMPTYIPPRTFSLALLHILANPHRSPDAAAPEDNQQLLAAIRAGLRTVSPQLREALQPLVGGGVQTLDQAQQNIEEWFNAKMDRVSGAYKRRVQWWVAVIGLITAITLNADSISVATALWQTPTLRTAIANQAEALAGQSSTTGNPPTAADFSAVQEALQSVLIFPLGWDGVCVRSSGLSASLAGGSFQPNCTPGDVMGWLSKIVGLTATVLAVSLGAPFWFDLLRKVSNLRSSGPAPNKPASATTPGRA
jgi:hypothetical protein